MVFLIAMLIVAISCLAITYKTLVGYSNFSLWIRLFVFLMLFIAWFSPVILRFIREFGWLSGTSYAIAAKSAYFLMGFAFILFMVLLFRDIIWYAVYYLSRNESLSPDNVHLLNRNNVIALVFSLVIAVWGVYEANKQPAIKEMTISDNRIKQDTKVIVASDFHIDQATPLWQIKNFVEGINSTNPDYILLVGDIIDDVPNNLKTQMEELKKLKAKKIFVSLGNHEYYNAPVQWMIEFTNMGFEVLQNTGENLNDTGLFISGIPDSNSAEHNFQRALEGSTENQYKVLMSHAPHPINQIEKDQFNLQVSGHTHGGQIFPFHFFAKSANGYLAGSYQVNGNQLYITRGAGYWGPPMRILAPSDITVINFKPENKQ